MSDAGGLFAQGRVAAGYAACRPRFHPQVLERVRADLSLPAPLGQALDIGCGTGLSTVPLCALARRVTGVDGAVDMIARADRSTGAHYLVSSAERVPLASDRFDLITVCGAINWIDRSLFLAEARRLLRESGWMVVYDGTDLTSMVGDARLETWHREQYLKRLPRPPRDERPITPPEAGGYGLQLFESQDYVLELPFHLEEYVGFLLTQSNVTAAVEEGRESAEDLRAWMTRGLGDVFGARQRSTRFGGYIWYLRPA